MSCRHCLREWISGFRSNLSFCLSLSWARAFGCGGYFFWTHRVIRYSMNKCTVPPRAWSGCGACRGGRAAVRARRPEAGGERQPVQEGAGQQPLHRGRSLDQTSSENPILLTSLPCTETRRCQTSLPSARHWMQSIKSSKSLWLNNYESKYVVNNGC